MIPIILLGAFLVAEAENLQEVDPTQLECHAALSLVQKNRLEKKMTVEKGMEESLMGVDPQWFPNTHGNLQTRATNLTFFTEKCNAGTDPNNNLLGDARTKHATCRSEQQAIMGSNVTQNCTSEKKAACDAMQSIFEESYCNYAHGKEDYCQEFEACHDAADSSYTSSKQEVEQQEQHLKDLFTQHTRLECKVNAWPLTTSSNNDCDSLAVDTTHLGVTYPTKPARNACTYPVVPVPGDSDWLAAEYSSKSWAALVEPVTPCTTTTTTPVATVLDLSSAEAGQYPDDTGKPARNAVDGQIDTVEGNGPNNIAHTLYIGPNIDAWWSVRLSETLADITLKNVTIYQCSDCWFRIGLNRLNLHQIWIGQTLGDHNPATATMCSERTAGQVVVYVNDGTCGTVSGKYLTIYLPVVSSGPPQNQRTFAVAEVVIEATVVPSTQS